MLRGPVRRNYFSALFVQDIEGGYDQGLKRVEIVAGDMSSTSVGNWTYLYVSLDFVAIEWYNLHGEVCMDCLPVSVELLIADVWQLVEEERDLDAWLSIGHCIIGEALLVERVVDLLYRHAAHKVHRQDRPSK